jgi:predicted ATPase/signal transduction histidine kinase/tRNA A-37 threonylcarbamoyl transferase component Bud32
MDIPGYEIVDTLHEGANSSVYRAVRVSDRSQVILKTTSRHATGRLGARLRFEYDLLSKLQIPGVQRVIGLERGNIGLILVTEDSGSQSLAEVMQHTPLSLMEVLEVARKLVTILKEVHQNNIIHKDINPSNILYHPGENQVYLIDFGSASILSQENSDAQTLDYMEGTLAYISPEQTGRMNRPIDYRTDFYALGITLFQLVTGRLPFQCEESLEWVHAHIAKPPPSPRELKPELPEAVSKIILKLLEKNAEHRYQSHEGLIHDLNICMNLFKAKGAIPDFSLGQNDFSYVLQIPSWLFGREREIDLLLQQYHHMQEGGQTTVTSIIGSAGTGKSMLVKELQAVFSKDYCFFVEGKFDQLQKNTPYLGITEAFQELIRDILTLKPEAIRQWKQKIHESLGSNAKVIANLIPELEIITGPLPDLIPLGPAETQHRFHRVFQSFINLFAKKKHPLVLFLDDIQWADASSMELILDLLSDDSQRYFYLILAARPTEQLPLFTRRLSSLAKQGIMLKNLDIEGLQKKSIDELLSETLKCGLEEVRTLSDVIEEKTKGNPFFIKEFLGVLYRSKLVYFSSEEEKWDWDIHKILGEHITDNVVDLMLERIKDLPKSSLECIQYAAYLGHRFELDDLAVAMDRAPDELNQNLFPALQEGILIPLGGSYKYHQGAGWEAGNLSSQEKLEYQFAHDRVQRAAYQSVSEHRGQQMHLNVGRLMRAHYQEDAQNKVLFAMLDHLNHAEALVSDQSERLTLSGLNLKAALAAKESAAYFPARKYLEAGLKWLGEDRWSSHYELSLQFAKIEAELAFLSKEYQRALEITQDALSKTHGLIEKTDLYITQIQTHVATAKLSEAIRVGRHFLNQLGVNIPLKPGKPHFLWELIKTKMALRGKPIASLANLPGLEDENKKEAVRIIQNLIIPSYFINQELWLILNFKSIRLYLDAGSSTQESFSYSVFAVVEGILGNFNRSKELVDLTFATLDKWSDSTQICPTYQVLGVGSYSFLHPYPKVQELLSRGIAAGLDTGELIFTGLSSLHLASLGFFSGEPLKSAAEEISWQVELNIKLEQLHFHVLHIILRSIEQITEREVVSAIPELRHLSREDSLQNILDTENIPNICTAYQMMAIGHFFNHELGEAFKYIKKAEAYMENVAGVFYEKELLAYGSLIRLYLLEKRGKKLAGRTKRQIRKKQNKLKHWSDFSPVNIRAKYELIEGMIKSFDRNPEALTHFEKAIEWAKKEGMLQWEALTHERMAHFLLATEKKEQAQYHTTKALLLFGQWGAVRRMALLEKNWSAKEPIALSRTQGELRPSATMETQTYSGSTRFSALEQFDLQTVIKATQTISSEIKLDSLLSALLDIVLENAGAQYVALIIRDGEQLYIQAEGWVDKKENRLHDHFLLENSEMVPESIIQYVNRTKEAVVIHESGESTRFEKDPYLVRHQPKSILCAPIINQNRLMGSIYLDNKITANAFTEQRLEILKILSTQIAISLENALLYENLEEKVRERTAEIERQKAEIEKAKEEALAAEAVARQANEAKSEFLSTISHELRTPLTSIIGFAKINEKRLEEKVFPKLSSDDPANEKLIKRIKSNNEVIISEGGRLTSLINELLDLAKIEAGKVEWHIEPANLLKVINQATLATDALFEQKPGIQLIKKLPEALPVAPIDKNRFIQVIINLISNAVKFTDSGSVTISASEQDRQIVVQVADTGSGIPPEYQDQVFEKFKQVKDQQLGKPKGTGLGLPICKEIVEYHGGRIWVESEVGKGSVFSFSVPLEQEE